MEDDNEWETIQSSTSASQSDEDDAVVVTRLPNYHPPTNHETLSIPPQPSPPQEDRLQEPPQEILSPPSSYSSSTTAPSYTTEIVEGELPQPPEVINTITLLKASFGVLSSWVLRIAYGVRTRIGFWSIVSVGAFFTVMTYARRWQQRRKLAEKDHTAKLLFLLHQKDEKIKQLLLQMDRMNETLSARRRVPVIRVVVDSPVVISPRLH